MASLFKPLLWIAVLGGALAILLTGWLQGDFAKPWRYHRRWPGVIRRKV